MEDEQWSKIRRRQSNDQFFFKVMVIHLPYHHCCIIVSTKLLNTQKSNVVRNSNVLESYN